MRSLILAAMLAAIAAPASAQNNSWQYNETVNSCLARSWNVKSQTGYSMILDTDGNVKLVFDKGAPFDADFSNAISRPVTLTIDGQARTYPGTIDVDDEVVIVDDFGSLSDKQVIMRLMSEQPLVLTAGKQRYVFRTENIREPLVALSVCAQGKRLAQPTGY